MPWRNSVMDDRTRFISELIKGESMSKVCRDFDISRKTGYKFWKRYKENGHVLPGSSRPFRLANQLPEQTEALILRLKQKSPHWGARKIRELFRRKYSDFRLPATSTFHAVFSRNGLVKKMKKRVYKAEGTKMSVSSQPNDLWYTDYKGEFIVNGKYCYPLTITDDKSRFLLCCEGLSSTKESYAFEVFKRVFKRYGLPKAIRTDNGVPFSSPMGLFGLSKLSVWWLSLGISVERIQPGHPEQNGRHERMHLTLKRETTRPAGNNFLQQRREV